MGQRSNELTPHRSLRDFWGAELRELRASRGWSLVELGRRLYCNPSYLAKIERAERPIPAGFAERCDEIFGTQGTLVRLQVLAESVDHRLVCVKNPAKAQVSRDDVSALAEGQGRGEENSFGCTILRTSTDPGGRWSILCPVLVKLPQGEVEPSECTGERRCSTDTAEGSLDYDCGYVTQGMKLMIVELRNVQVVPERH